MTRQDKLLARMRRNPRGDWRIEQLKRSPIATASPTGSPEPAT
jgi:hypothetical protein